MYLLLKSNCYRNTTELQSEITSFTKNNCYSLTFVPFIILFFFLFLFILEKGDKEDIDNLRTRIIILIEAVFIFCIFSALLAYWNFSPIWVFLLFILSLLLLQALNFYDSYSLQDYVQMMKEQTEIFYKEEQQFSNISVIEVILQFTTVCFLFSLLRFSNKISMIDIKEKIISF